jgi:hypothetical protein
MKKSKLLLCCLSLKSLLWRFGQLIVLFNESVSLQN